MTEVSRRTVDDLKLERNGHLLAKEPRAFSVLPPSNWHVIRGPDGMPIRMEWTGYSGQSFEPISAGTKPPDYKPPPKLPCGCQRGRFDCQEARALFRRMLHARHLDDDGAERRWLAAYENHVSAHPPRDAP